MTAAHPVPDLVPLAPAAAPLPDHFYGTHPAIAALLQPEGKRILDVGCGAGGLGATLLARRAREVVGLEGHRPAAVAARGVLNAVFRLPADGSGVSLPYPRGHFDVLTVAQLGHLADPAATLQALLPYLAADGQVVLGLPNARHESVALALLVDGRWDYAQAGSVEVLESRNLRLFTRSSAEALLDELGLVADGPFVATRSDPSAYLERAAQLIAGLDGDPDSFRDEGTVVSYQVSARRATPGDRRRNPPLPDAWQGARPVRVLMAPSLDDGRGLDDRHESTLRALARAYGAEPDVTIGVALPAPALAAVPATIQRAAADGEGDLLLVAEPTDDDGWRRLLAGASLLVLTSHRPRLQALADELGVETAEGRATES